MVIFMQSFKSSIPSIKAGRKQEDKEAKDGKIIRQQRRYRSFNVGKSVYQDDFTANF